MNIGHRKINRSIRFTDAQGNAISNATISVKQRGHEFLFGCGGFEFIPYAFSEAGRKSAGGRLP